MAWTRRRDLNQPAGDQPIQVAEAPATPGDAAPSYIRDWRSISSDAPAQVTGVVTPTQTAAQNTAQSGAPAQLASAAPSSVSAAWASRGVVDPPASPSRWSLAPTADQRETDRRETDRRETGREPIAAPVRLASAEMPALPTPPAAPARRVHMQLVHPAPPPTAAPRQDGTHGWSVQVGAFGTQAQANQAAGMAQSHAPSLSHARAEIAGIKQGRGARIYRARLTGLSHGDAMQACQRLAHGNSNCLVVSPDARS
jgi:hypothetical protein